MTRTRPQVVINVNGGLVQGVFASLSELQVIVVDWDTEEINNFSRSTWFWTAESVRLP